MAVEFGLRLRKELINLQKTTTVQWAQTQTSDTVSLGLLGALTIHTINQMGFIPGLMYVHVVRAN